MVPKSGRGLRIPALICKHYINELLSTWEYWGLDGDCNNAPLESPLLEVRQMQNPQWSGKLRSRGTSIFSVTTFFGRPRNVIEIIKYLWKPDTSFLAAYTTLQPQWKDRSISGICYVNLKPSFPRG